MNTESLENRAKAEVARNLVLLRTVVQPTAELQKLYLDALDAYEVVAVNTICIVVIDALGGKI